MTLQPGRVTENGQGPVLSPSLLAFLLMCRCVLRCLFPSNLLMARACSPSFLQDRGEPTCFSPSTVCPGLSPMSACIDPLILVNSFVAAVVERGACPRVGVPHHLMVFMTISLWPVPLQVPLCVCKILKIKNLVLVIIIIGKSVPLCC